jgi:hypothetical protein
MLAFELREAADRAHLGHAPGMQHLDAVFLLEALGHRRRRGRAADRQPLQRREAQAVLGHIVQQTEPHRRHTGAHRHLLGLEQLVEALRVERSAGEHRFGADQHHRIGQAPGIHMEHGHDRADDVARREVEAVGQRRAVGMQHRGAMLVESAFWIAGRARGVAERGGEPLVEYRPGEIVAFRREQILIAERIRRRAGHRRAIGERHPMLYARAMRAQLLDHVAADEVEEHGSVFGVIDDVDDLVVEQSRIDRVADRAHARDGVVEFEMAVTVPGEGRDAIAYGDPEPRQRVGEPPRARMRRADGVAMERPIARTADDLGGAVMTIGMLDQR